MEYPLVNFVLDQFHLDLNDYKDKPLLTQFILNSIVLHKDEYEQNCEKILKEDGWLYNPETKHVNPNFFIKPAVPNMVVAF